MPPGPPPSSRIQTQSLPPPPGAASAPSRVPQQGAPPAGSQRPQPASLPPPSNETIVEPPPNKIANPTVLARIPREELRSLLEGYGHAPRFVEGDDPAAMHELMAATLEGIERFALFDLDADPASGTTSQAPTPTGSGRCPP